MHTNRHANQRRSAPQLRRNCQRPGWPTRGEATRRTAKRRTAGPVKNIRPAGPPPSHAAHFFPPRGVFCRRPGGPPGQAPEPAPARPAATDVQPRRRRLLVGDWQALNVLIGRGRVPQRRPRAPARGGPAARPTGRSGSQAARAAPPKKTTQGGGHSKKRRGPGAEPAGDRNGGARRQRETAGDDRDGGRGCGARAGSGGGARHSVKLGRRRTPQPLVASTGGRGTRRPRGRGSGSPARGIRGGGPAECLHSGGAARLAAHPRWGRRARPGRRAPGRDTAGGDGGEGLERVPGTARPRREPRGEGRRAAGPRPQSPTAPPTDPRAKRDQRRARERPGAGRKACKALPTLSAREIRGRDPAGPRGGGREPKIGPSRPIFILTKSP